MIKQMPDYGLDAPAVMRNLFIAAIFAPIINKIFCAYLYQRYPFYVLDFFASWFCFGIIFIAFFCPALCMYFSSRYGKIILRDKMVSSLNMQGTERVLDIGCGRGLMLIALAKKLTMGRAVGIDTWDDADLSGNSLEAAQDNAVLEGVSHRVSILTGNACSLPFEQNSFDIVVSNLVFHNIDGYRARERALQEIVRVLRPGGRVLIADFLHAREYVDVLKKAGLEYVSRSGLQYMMFPPVRLVSGIKVK